jgi:hypothetical protein
MKMLKMLVLAGGLMMGNAFAGSQITIVIEDPETGITEAILFQFADLGEAIDFMADKYEERKGNCDPRVKSITVEEKFIPGLDD